MEPPDPEAGGGGGRGRGGPPPRVTKERRHQPLRLGRAPFERAAPAARRVSGALKVGDVDATQPFNVLIDPRIAADGVTAADLKEQFDHNVRMRELSAAAAQLLGRVRAPA